MMLYEKAKSEKWSREKLLETIALLEDELSYEKSVANKLRHDFLGDDRTYKSDVELLERARGGSSKRLEHRPYKAVVEGSIPSHPITIAEGNKNVAQLTMSLWFSRLGVVYDGAFISREVPRTS